MAYGAGGYRANSDQHANRPFSGETDAPPTSGPSDPNDPTKGGGGGGGLPIGGLPWGKIIGGAAGLGSLFGGGTGGSTSSAQWNSKYYNQIAAAGAQPFLKGAQPIQAAGLQQLYQLLMNQGRVDPRLLASAQAQNARSTQSQQDAARGRMASSGYGTSGLGQALQAAIGSAGANRSANLNYQDIADSYARQQQNLGLVNQNVTRPLIDYAALGLGQYGTDVAAKQSDKAAQAGFLSGIADIFRK